MNLQEYNDCVKAHADGLYRFLKKNLKDDMEAENIVQNTFEKLWIRRDEIRPESAKAYIFKVGYNNMIDVIRKNKRTSNLEEVKEVAYDGKSYTDLKEILNKAISKLPEHLRTPLLLRDYEGYDYRSIGEITGLNEGQVKINIFRARKAMREFIGSPGNLM